MSLALKGVTEGEYNPKGRRIAIPYD